MGQYDKIVIVRNNVNLQVLVILVVAFMLPTNGQINNRLIYRFTRPVPKGERRFLPNAPWAMQKVKLRRI